MALRGNLKFIMGIEELFLLFLGIIVPVWAIVDMFTNLPLRYNKTMWILLVIFLPLLGPIIYLVFTRFFTKPKSREI
ncbi:MAG: PLDc_N domain-containing protein [Pedobacter sp.]|nr:MAG: PLDc_N domain-containing protein [Pedobacter sp.]